MSDRALIVALERFAAALNDEGVLADDVEVYVEPSVYARLWHMAAQGAPSMSTEPLRLTLYVPSGPLVIRRMGAGGGVLCGITEGVYKA